VKPLFLAGADGVTPELRAPSIKGALRFWWRAINGEYKNYTVLKEQEATIFGDTSKRSRFALSVRLISQNGEQVKLFNETNDYVKNYPGIHCLLY